MHESNLLGKSVRVHDKYVSSTLKFCSINVCGLKSKQIYPEFISFIQQFDIIGLQETKLDNLDTIELDGFRLFFKHRKEIAKRRSGGIVLCVRETLSPYITILESDSKLVLWFKISDKIIANENTLYGVVYVPPENSDFSNPDPFSEIQYEIEKFSENSASICMFGDWNSRTKLLNDIVEMNYDIFHINNLDDLYFELNENIEKFNYCTTVKRQRNNCDRSVNNYGYRFVEFLHANDMFILNGRTNGDLNGNCTCKNVSSVDYFICTSDMFKFVDSLTVHDFCPMYSDVHCPISLLLDFCNKPLNESTPKLNKFTIFDQDKAHVYCSNIKEDRLCDIYSKLLNIETLDNIGNELNEVTEEISELLVQSSEETFGVKYINTKNNDNNHNHYNNEKTKQKNNGLIIIAIELEKNFILPNISINYGKATKIE